MPVFTNVVKTIWPSRLTEGRLWEGLTDDDVVVGRGGHLAECDRLEELGPDPRSHLPSTARPWALSNAMTAPVVITLSCPGFHSATSEAAVCCWNARRPPAANAWTGTSAATEGSESIAGTGAGDVVVVLSRLAGAQGEMDDGSREVRRHRRRGGHELKGKVAELRQELLEPQLGTSLDHEVLPECGRQVLAGTAADPVRPARHAELHRCEWSEVTVRNETDGPRSGPHPSYRAAPARGSARGCRPASGWEKSTVTLVIESGVGGARRWRHRGDRQRCRRDGGRRVSSRGPLDEGVCACCRAIRVPAATRATRRTRPVTIPKTRRRLGSARPLL